MGQLIRLDSFGVTERDLVGAVGGVVAHLQMPHGGGMY